MIKRILLLLPLLLLPLLSPVAAAADPASSSAPVPGVDYEIIEGGTPFEPLNGKIEVVEVFGYWCPHCANFQPMVDTWKRTLAKDVRLTYVPLQATDDDQFAPGYYAALSTGLLARTHNAIFIAVSTDKTLPRNPTADELVAFYATRGANPQTFAAAMQSAATIANVKRARDFAIRSNVPGTPTMVINGKYRVLGQTQKDMLRITDQLIAQERAARR